MLRFSVCIPAYNEEESLERLVLNLNQDPFFQSAAEKEVIIGLNGCNDQSESIALRLAEKFDWLKVLVLPHKGKNKAWKALVQSVTIEGPIFFFDADVVIPEGTLEQLYQKISESTDLAIVGAYPMPFEASHHSHGIHQKLFIKWFYYFTEIHQKHYLGLCGRGYVIRESEARKVNFPADERIADDQFLELQFIDRFKVLTSANVYFGPANFFDAAKQSARIFSSHYYLKTYYPQYWSRRVHAPQSFKVKMLKLFALIRPSFFLWAIFRFARALFEKVYLCRAIKMDKAEEYWVKIQSSKSF